MAEGPDPFVKLEEQVKCPVCIDIFTTPKLLSCNHALCKDCIDHLPVDVDKGHHIVKCPTCRKPTTLPHDDAANLPPAFHINTLIEVHHAALQVPATVSDKPEVPKCPIHNDRSLEMYCEDCSELACTKCFHHKHREHTGDYVTDLFDRHKQDINDSLVAVEQHVQGAILHAHESLVTQEREIIHLKERVDRLLKQKLHQIAKQKEDGEVFLAHLKSNKKYIQDKLCSGSQQEILMEKHEMIERLRIAGQDLMLHVQQLQPKENVFQHSHDILEKCNKMLIGEVGVGGTVDVAKAKPSTKVAVIGRHRSIEISVPNVSRLKRSLLSCHLVADEEDNVVTQCKVKHVEKDKYCISFTPIRQGLHRPKVQIKGADFCNPCAIRVLLSPKFRQVNMIENLNMPQGIAVTPTGLLLVTKRSDKEILVLNRHGSVVERFQHQGGGYPKGVCITPDDHILVVGEHGPHIAMYTMDYALVVKAKSNYGNGSLQFKRPQGIAVNGCGHVYVCDTGNHRIQVLTPDLAYYYEFGKKGSKPGRFRNPCGIAIDSQGIVYVCDWENDRIQKLYNDGTYIGEFKVKSKSPHKIAIDNKDMVYVASDDEMSIYDSNGDYLGCTDSVATHGLATDEQGHIYACQDSSRINIYESITSI